MIFLIIIGLLWIAPIFVARNMAIAKGRGAGVGTALGFFLGWLGVLIMAVLSTDHQSTSAPGRRPCPHCAEQIQRAAVVCRFCGRPVEPAPAVERLTFLNATGLSCPEGHVNPVGLRKCQVCGSKSLTPF